MLRCRYIALHTIVSKCFFPSCEVVVRQQEFIINWNENIVESVNQGDQQSLL